MNFSEIFPGVIFAQFAPNIKFIVLSNGTRVIVKEIDQLQPIDFTNSQIQDAQIQQIEISPNSELVALSYPKKGYIEIRKIDISIGVQLQLHIIDQSHYLQFKIINLLILKQLTE